jgi:hypothetical protein
MHSGTDKKVGKTTAWRWAARTIAALVAVGGVGVLGASQGFAADVLSVTSVYFDNTTTDHVEGVTYGPLWGAGSSPIATFTDSAACPTPLTCQPAGDYTARVLWGDGTPATTCPATDCTITFGSSSGTVGTYKIAASHQYVDEKNTTGTPSIGFTIRVVARDTVDAAVSPTGDNSGNAGLSVKDQPSGLITPTFSFNAAAGTPFTGQIAQFQDGNQLAVATDQGAAAVPEYTFPSGINWGDGSAIDNTTAKFTIDTINCGTAPGLGAGQGCPVFLNGGPHTYAAPGTYTVAIVVKDGLSPSPITVTGKANVSGNAGSNCTTATTTLAPSNPTLATGATQVFTATSTACTAPKFQFWLQYPAGTGPWVVVQPFSNGTATWSWNTTGANPGAYKVVVWANQTGHAQSTFEAYAQTNVTLTGCGAVTVTWSPASPQPSGTNPVKLTGATSGCAAPQFEFWMLAPGSSTWMDVQPYGSAAGAVLSWNTSGSVHGTYNFSVWAKDTNSGGASGNSLGRWDNYFATTYTLTSVTCTSMSVTTTPPNTAPVGTNPVTLKGYANPCTFPLYQFWLLAPGSSTWVKVQAYSNSTTFNWDTTAAAKGMYHFSVWLKDSGSAGTYGNTLGRWDVYEAVTYTLT